MNYIIDSSAWVEYLKGSTGGKKVSEILKTNDEIYVIFPIISEVVSYIKRNKGNVETAYESIIKNAKIYEITPRIAKETGILHAEKKEKNENFPMVDSLIVCCAKAIQAKIITTDSHFKHFKEAIFI